MQRGSMQSKETARAGRLVPVLLSKQGGTSIWKIKCQKSFEVWTKKGFSGGSEVKASACNVGDLGSIPGLRRPPGDGNGNPLQYSCLQNPMDGGTWWAVYSPPGHKESDLTEWLNYEQRNTSVNISGSKGKENIHRILKTVSGQSERCSV